MTTHKRGIYAAIVPSATASGLLLGSLIAVSLTGVLDDDALISWGWRVPFLIALPLGLYGLWIRRNADESSRFENQDDTEESPLREVIKYPKALAIAFSGAVFNAIGFYVILTYLPIYLSQELGMAETPAIRPLGPPHHHAVRCTFHGVFIVPAFMLLDGAGILLVIIIQVCLGGVLALNDGVLPSFLSEQFPTHVRLSGFALTFNTANAVFGGTAPMIATWLIDKTDNQLAPAYYPVAAAIITGGGVLFASVVSDDE
ncbi:MFS transporter [Corynebacterium sp. FDAARGOS 1242]|uniref:MFS transporter n=1 Tax=Corynebacterium sp. FDAARGOS 1242 TaxID=2778078 RepID=UPI001EF238AD|nr:MFS transporter [Corynebacterium sp. FDAARGOS 1242]